jgi:hypothetical protein
MQDLIQSFSIVIATIGLLVGITYYIINFRNARYNIKLSKFNEIIHYKCPFSDQN